MIGGGIGDEDLVVVGHVARADAVVVIHFVSISELSD